MQATAKAVRSAQALVVTANRLTDGRVVWLAADGGWTGVLREAAVFQGEQVGAGLAAGEAAERQQLVVAPYAVEVTATDRGPRPLRMRERLRAAGPSVLMLAAA